MGTRHLHDIVLGNIFGTPTYLAPDDGAGGAGGGGAGAGEGGKAGEGAGNGEGGKAADGAGAGNGNGEGTKPPEGDGDKPLGPAGEKALQEERAARATAEKEAKRLAKEVDDLKRTQMSDQEKALADAKAEGRKESDGVYRGALVSALIRAEAGGKLADPEDAVRLLDLSDFDLGDDLKVDTKKVSSAIDELIKQKPYLAADGRRTVGSGEGGARRGASAAPDMNTLIRSAAGRG